MYGQQIFCPIFELSTHKNLPIDKSQAQSTHQTLRCLVKFYLDNIKARLTLLVCLTATAGYGMAPVTFDPYIALCATLGTAMASAAANSINQILEVPFDSQMNRTKNR